MTEMTMAHPSGFWDRHADGYAKRPVADEAAYQKKLEITQGYFRPEMEVLEFGCGTGSTAIVHAPFVKHIRATDISLRMLEIARDKADAQGITNITFEQAAFDDITAPDGSLDVVLGLSIVHLLDDRDAAIAKVYRMLKPGGLFVSSTVCLGETVMMRILGLVAPLGRVFGLLPLLRVFTARALQDSLTAAGFTLDHVWQPGKKGRAVFIVAKKPR